MPCRLSTAPQTQPSSRWHWQAAVIQYCTSHRKLSRTSPESPLVGDGVATALITVVPDSCPKPGHRPQVFRRPVKPFGIVYGYY